MTDSAEKRPVGRPSDFSDELADEICGHLIDGLSLRKICTRAGMPDRRTVLRWLDARPEFAAKYARARESQGDLMDDLILEAAEGANSDNAAAVRVKIDAYKWRASKLQPKKYGDSVQMKHSGAIGRFDASKYTDEQLDQLEAALGPLAAASGDAEGDPRGESEEGG